MSDASSTARRGAIVLAQSSKSSGLFRDIGYIDRLRALLRRLRLYGGLRLRAVLVHCFLLDELSRMRDWRISQQPLARLHLRED